MTLKSRNRLLLLSYIVILPALALYFYSLFSFLQIDSLLFQNFKNSPIPFLYSNLTQEFVLNGLFLFINIISSILIFINFRNTNSIEIFYLICFLNFSTLYAIQPLLTISFLAEDPSTLQILIIKIIFFAHFLSLGSLFFCGYFKTGVGSTNPEGSIFIGVIIALMFVGLQPVDSLKFETLILTQYGKIPSALILTTLTQNNFFIFLSIICGILIISCFIAAFLQLGTKNYLFLGLSILVLLIGANLIVFQVAWQAQVVALIFYTVAIGLFTNQTHQLYKWN